MTCPLHVAETDGIIAQGGTILGSSRTNPYRNPRDRPGRAPRATSRGWSWMPWS